MFFNSRRVHGLIFTWFFFSGMAGLIYEVLWSRQLGLVFGTTLYAVGTVLAVFMAGLALGSFLFGRLADKTDNPLRLYAFLEGGLGLYVLAIGFLFQGLEALQVTILPQLSGSFFGLSLIRVVLSFLVLIVPTTLMGGTLPLIAKFFVRREHELGSRVGHLYFINTLGAALGSFLTGFALIPLIGVQETTYVAAAVNLAIGTGAFLLQRYLARAGVPEVVEAGTAHALAREPKKSGRRGEATPATPYSGALRMAVLVGFSLSGFASLSLEVSWTRVLTLVLGSSVYAFSLMLTAFLLGIALGSLAMARFIDRWKNLWLAFFVAEALIGIAIIVLNPILGQLPLLFIRVFSSFKESFWALQTMQFLLSFLIMLVPTIIMGAAFPIATRIYTEDIKRVGRFVGVLYSGNTFGAVAGTLLTSFVIIPMIGIQKSIALVALIYLAVAATVLILGPLRRMGRSLVAGALAVIAIAGFLLPTWDKQVLISGVFVYGEDYLGEAGEGADLRDLMKGYSLLFYKEGLQATVSVGEFMNGERALRIDGKADASSKGDLYTELLLGHLPMLLHPMPEKVLVVGLGSGITLGAVEQYPGLKRVDAVEIEPAVVQAASYFSLFNHNALDHPKLNMVVADGRNYVLASKEKYDVIIAEPSNPWISGSSILFTGEQYQLYRERLAEDGIVCQWLHFYNMGTQDLKTALNTFQSVFPHAALWGVRSDLLLIGSMRELTVDFQGIRARMQQKEVQADLERVGIEEPSDLTCNFVMDEQSLSSYCGEAPLHTDNHPILEFSAPRSLYRSTVQDNIESMKPYEGSILPLLTNVGGPEAEAKIKSGTDFREHFQQAQIYQQQGNTEGARVELEKALAIKPKSFLVCQPLSELYSERGLSYLSKGDLNQAMVDLNKAIELDPENSLAYNRRGMAYLNQDDLDHAIADFSKVIQLNPNIPWGYMDRGSAYSYKEEYDKAAADYLKAIALDPTFTDAYINLGGAYLSKQDYAQAVAEFTRAIELEPDMAYAYFGRGQAYRLLDTRDKAIADFQRSIALDPDSDLAQAAGIYIDRLKAE